MKNSKPIFYLIVILTLLNCREQEERSEKSANWDPNTLLITKEQFNSNALQLGKLVERDFPTMVPTTGEIDVPPENRAEINAYLGGYVKRTSLLVGDKVRAGQALLTLENPEYIDLQQHYMEVAEQLDYLKTDFERQGVLLEEKVTSEKKFLQAKSSYRTNLAVYNGLKQKLRMLNIDPLQVETGNITSEITLYAPITGNITAMDISRGMFVSPTDRIMEIVNNEHMHLELIAFEKDIMKIAKGQEIVFSTPENTAETYQAEVHLVGKTVDRNSRTIKVHGHLPDSLATRFTVGMFVEAQIVSEKVKYPALPEEAVVTKNGYSYVLRLQGMEGENHIFSKVAVTPSASYGGYIGLEDNPDLKSGDQFLIKGSFGLIDE
tara:strand:+ start:13284 stop:14417 length:1134 start_codon:yes stop_codon:yes gene_type:complete